ncbi:hypothetical protein DFH08DRAFT_693030, partial [Mycena albidolilacea]
HRPAVFHFDIDGPSRTMLNPDPPSAELSQILFPTLPAALDPFIDVLHEPPRPPIHRKFSSHVSSWIAYLRQYTFPGKRFYTTADPNTKKTSITPEVLSIIAQTKEENHPTLLRQFHRTRPLEFAQSVKEYRPPSEIPYSLLEFKAETPILAGNPLQTRWEFFIIDTTYILLYCN